jgi:hypothetical protein
MRNLHKPACLHCFGDENLARQNRFSRPISVAAADPKAIPSHLRKYPHLPSEDNPADMARAAFFVKPRRATRKV